MSEEVWRPVRGADLLLDPDRESAVMSAWERLLRGERSTDVVRRVVDDSWHRCLDARVDPAVRRAPPPLGEDRLVELRNDNDQLVVASLPLIEQGRDFLSQTETVMLLTDRGGTILQSAGDPRILEQVNEVRLIPGCNWREVSCGTNAIGTALSLEAPVQIHGAEHFCEGIKHWTCSAAVIRDPLDGSVLGAVDLSALAKNYSRHGLALIVSLAAQIETRLAKSAAERRYRLLERCIGELNRADPVIVIDHLGRLVKSSAHGPAALARLGASGRLEQSFPIPDIAAIADGRVPDRMPDWLRRVQIEAIKDGNEILGYLLAMPAKPGLLVDLRYARAEDASVRPPVFSQIVGESQALLEALQKARQLARTSVSVLLYGETGVGKELFAQGIHEASERRGGPFIALNCGGLSRDLLTSELFGYGEGAFTGARKAGMAGKIESAHRGTLFLDEIGEMPLDIQPHLLRVLESGEIYRLGENTARKVDFRLIAATHRDLRSAAADGSFRMDLYYRLAVTCLSIPPLRDRKDDLPNMIEHWLRVLCGRHGVDQPTIADEAYQCLLGYSWPGNVRELRNTIEGAVLMARGGTIGIADLPDEIAGTLTAVRPSAGAQTFDRPLEASARTASLEAVELSSIRSAMEQNHGNVTRAALQLGIAKSTLYEKLRKHGLLQELDSARSKRHD
jgi:sigma-54 dependent transcriptional regulator, acetoin dehydrogenase operon transcriptional activator AcoR